MKPIVQTKLNMAAWKRQAGDTNMVDIQKIAERMESRKNNTAKAVDDLYSIFHVVSEMIPDTVSLFNPVGIDVKWGELRNGVYKEFSENSPWIENISIRVRNGKLGIFYMPSDGESVIIKKDEITYINLFSASKSLNSILEKLMDINTFESEKDIFSKMLESAKS